MFGSTPQTKKALAKAALRLGIIGLPPKPPAEEVKLARGHRHDKGRDAAAISHHYDVGNDFYRLVLGESMTYSCGYWAQPGEDLAAAQYAKCDLVARKLGLTAGMRVLDVGCGWGTFALHAARNYGVHVVGVTLSHEQADYASKRMVDEGVAEWVEIRVQDYRDVTTGPSTRSPVSAWPSTSASRCCRPTPRTCSRCYARRAGCSTTRSRGDQANRAGFSKTSFIDRYVFPDGEIEPMATMIDALEGAGFEVRDVESLREHYALTLRAWVANLEANWEEAVTLSSAGRARVWRHVHGGLGAGVYSEPARGQPDSGSQM